MNLFLPAAIALVAIVIFIVVHPAQKFVFMPSMVVAFVDPDVFVAFNMIAYCLFLLGGLGMYKEMKCQ